MIDVDERSKSYRPLPFWSWNDKLEIDKLIEQLRWMYENGVGGVFMHARSGLETEYLSEEWMACIKACAKESAKLGIKGWAYDESGWPSGFVGGKLLENEENKDRYLEKSIGVFDASATVSYLLTEEELIRVSHGGTEGEYLNLYIRTATSTVDILSPEVVEQFLTLTHEAYKESLGEDFSKLIEGFFTDEPEYYRWSTPYTKMVKVYFEEVYGEDIFDSLGLLFVEKKGYRKFRYRYWKAMQKLMLENFAKRYYTWCNENGVKLTGHYIEETSLAYQMQCCAGIMPFYQYEHIPGIDWLGRTTDLELPVKQVASVASQMGKKQVLTETFGCCGWDVSLADLRRIAGFQYVNGITMMCHHLTPYSERGMRKYDYPAHYSNDNPWVQEDFKTFNDYYTRLGYLLGEGDKYVNVAMLHPLRSAYFDYKWELIAEGRGIAKLDQKLQEACRMLSCHGIEYHFLDETLLAEHGFVEGASIGCGQCKYDYLVLPFIVTMDKSTEELLRKYIEQGGKVLLLGETPTYLEHEEHSYDYLCSNVTVDEIRRAQIYQIDNEETKIYSTYRVFSGKEFLYVMNSSESETYTQVYHCGKRVKSFVRVDLTNLTEKKVPLSVTLKPGEDALLIFSEEQLLEKRMLRHFSLYFENAEVSVRENYMPVDMIRYSTDGKEYSKPWPCAGLFQKLIKEQYQGNIYFRYDFEIQTVPDRIFLRTERSRDIAAWFNGELLTESIPSDKDYVNLYDITSLVQFGTNSYVVQVDWYEHENVYYALFGENVTESLRNCLVYNTELQPIELIGRFGVYPKHDYIQDEHPSFVRGKTFVIGDIPTHVTEPSVEGFPFLAGEMILRQKVMLESTDILLQVAGDYQNAFVKLNGKDVGKLFFDKEIDISEAASAGENVVEVRFLLSNRNRMGPHHYRGTKRVVSPQSFCMLGTWTEDESPLYHEDYDIKKFY